MQQTVVAHHRRQPGEERLRPVARRQAQPSILAPGFGFGVLVAGLLLWAFLSPI
jgi:hypothetical protein